MSNFKKALALLMVLCFTVALVACGGDSEDTKKTTKATVTVASTSAGKTTTTKKGQKVTTTGKAKTTQDIANDIKTKPGESKILPLVARTTNGAGNASASFIKSLKGYKLKLFYPWENIYGTKDAEKTAKKAIKAVEDEFGVTITDDGKFNNYNETLASDLAARNCKEQIYYAQNTYFASWFKNNYLCNLNTAMRTAGVDFGDDWYISEAKGFLNVNGNQYGWIPYEDEYTMPFSIVYNKNLLKKKNLTDPATLAAKGQWTWSKLESYSKKYINDKSVTGFAAQHTQELLAVLANQYGTSLCKVSKGSTPTTNISNTKFKSALTTLASWTTGKKPWCDTFSNSSWNEAKSQLSAGKIAMLYGVHDDIQALANSSSDFGIVQFPTKSGTTKYTNIAIPQFICFIPAQYQKDAAKILFIRNEYYRQNYRFSLRNFQFQWEQYFDDSDALNNASNIKYAKKGNKTVFSWVSVCEKSDAKITTSTVIKSVISGSKTPASAITAYKSSLTKTYSDVWKGYRITGNV